MDPLRSGGKKHSFIGCLLLVGSALLLTAFIACDPVVSVNVQHNERLRQHHQLEQYKQHQQQHLKKGLLSDRGDSHSSVHNSSGNEPEPQRRQGLQARTQRSPRIKDSDRLTGGSLPTAKKVSSRKAGTSGVPDQFRNEDDAGTAGSTAVPRQTRSFRHAAPHRHDVSSGEVKTTHEPPGSRNVSSARFQRAGVAHRPGSHHTHTPRAATARGDHSLEGAPRAAAVSPSHANAGANGEAARATAVATAVAVGEDDPHGRAASARALPGVGAATLPAGPTSRTTAGTHISADAKLRASSQAPSGRKHLSQSSDATALVHRQGTARAGSTQATAPNLTEARHATAPVFASVAARGTQRDLGPVVSSLSYGARNVVPTAAPSAAATLSSSPSAAPDFNSILSSPDAFPASPAAFGVPAQETAAGDLSRASALGMPALAVLGTAADTAQLKLVDVASPSSAATRSLPLVAATAPATAPAGIAEQPASNLSNPDVPPGATATSGFPAAVTTVPSAPDDPLSGAVAAPPTVPAVVPPPPPLPVDPAGGVGAQPFSPADAAVIARSFSVDVDPLVGNTDPSAYVNPAGPAPPASLPANTVLTAAAQGAAAGSSLATPGGSPSPTGPTAVVSNAAETSAPATPVSAGAPVNAAAVPDANAGAPVSTAAPVSGGAPPSVAAPATDAANAPETTSARPVETSDADASELAVRAAADSAPHAVLHAAAPDAVDPANAAPPAAPPHVTAAVKGGTTEEISLAWSPRIHMPAEACFDECSCWPIWSMGIVVLVLNLTSSFVAFYHTANLFSRGLLSSQFYRGGGYWLLGVAALGLTTGGLIGALVPPSCWAGALYLGGFLVSLFLSFVLIGRRGALLGSLGGVGAGGVIGFFTQTGSLGIVIGMLLGLLFGIVIGFAPICRGLKVNERYVRASLGAERRLRRGRYTEDLDKGEKERAVSPNYRARHPGSPRESQATPVHSSDYLLPPLNENNAVAAETTASVNSSAAADAELEEQQQRTQKPTAE